MEVRFLNKNKTPIFKYHLHIVITFLESFWIWNSGKTILKNYTAQRDIFLQSGLVYTVLPSCVTKAFIYSTWLAVPTKWMAFHDKDNGIDSFGFARLSISET